MGEGLNIPLVCIKPLGIKSISKMTVFLTYQIFITLIKNRDPRLKNWLVSVFDSFNLFPFADMWIFGKITIGMNLCKGPISLTRDTVWNCAILRKYRYYNFDFLLGQSWCKCPHIKIKVMVSILSELHTVAQNPTK